MAVYKYVDISGVSPLPIKDRIPTLLFDTTSLGWDYLHEVISIQGRAHIADIGSSSLILHSHYENMWAQPWVEHTTLHQTCQWEHALRVFPNGWKGHLVKHGGGKIECLSREDVTIIVWLKTWTKKCGTTIMLLDTSSSTTCCLVGSGNIATGIPTCILITSVT